VSTIEGIDSVNDATPVWILRPVLHLYRLLGSQSGKDVITARRFRDKAALRHLTRRAIIRRWWDNIALYVVLSAAVTCRSVPRRPFTNSSLSLDCKLRLRELTVFCARKLPG